MVKKTLVVSFQKNCRGCEACVIEAQHQLERVGLDGSPIRIFRSGDTPDSVNFSVELDPVVNELDVEKIESVCPALVFTVEEKEEEPSGLTN